MVLSDDEYVAVELEETLEASVMLLQHRGEGVVVRGIVKQRAHAAHGHGPAVSKDL